MKGFTLYELIVTVIVIATLSALSMMHYRVQREKMLDTQAKTNLAVIIAAERDYFRPQGTFYVQNNEALLNTNLAVGLLPTVNKQWNYLTSQEAAVPPTKCCAQATRTVVPVRTWRLCSNEMEPVLGGTCGASASNCP